jgi:hypothetical protein
MPFPHLRFIFVVLARPLLAQQELLSNGNFEDAMEGWQFRPGPTLRDELSPKVETIDGFPSFILDVPKHEAKGGVLIHQVVDVSEGQTYMFSAAYRIEGSGKVIMKLAQANSPWGVYGCTKAFEPGAKWMRYVATFNARGLVEDNPPSARIVMSGAAGTVYLREISLMKVLQREIASKSGWFKTYGMDVVVKMKGFVGSKKKPAQPAPDTPRKKRPKPSDDLPVISAQDLLRAFSKDPEAGNRQYQDQPIRISGRITKLEAAPLGDILLGLEGGRISVLITVTDKQEKKIRAELGAAKTRISEFTAYAEEEKIPVAERRRRAVNARPSVELTGSFMSFREGIVKMRQGKNLIITEGTSLVP